MCESRMLDDAGRCFGVFDVCFYGLKGYRASGAGCGCELCFSRLI